MALISIAQTANNKKDLLQKGVADIFAREVKLSTMMSFAGLDGSWSTKDVRPNPDSMPAVAFSVLEDDLASVSGNYEQLEETCQPLGNFIDIDIRVRNDSSLLSDPAEDNVIFYTQQLARRFNDVALNGDPTVVDGTTPNGNPAFTPAGIRYRLLNPTKYKSDPTVSLKAPASLNLTETGVNESQVLLLKRYLDRMITLLQPDVMFVNYEFLASLMTFLAATRLLSTYKDEYDREIDSYRGVKFIDPGFKGATRSALNYADTSAWIMPWENSNGVATPTAAAASRFTSIYFAKLGAKNYHGIQPFEFDVIGPSPLDNPLKERITLHWGFGFMQEGYRDIGRLYGINIG